MPEVVVLDPFHEDLGRSVMVTEAIPGRSLAEAHPGPAALPAILEAAGRDLATLATVPVDGFGWVRRDPAAHSRLAAGHPTLAAFALEDLDARLTAVAPLLAARDRAAARRAVDRWAHLLDAASATLAHGDLDATHVFHRDGGYAGLIDLGEIRGADPWYDLGHLALHDGQSLPEPLLPALLAGYAQLTPLPPDAGARIRLWSLLIAVQRLARQVTRPPSPYRAHLAAGLRSATAALLDRPPPVPL